jgi:hypothetical protein
VDEPVLTHVHDEVPADAFEIALAPAGQHACNLAAGGTEPLHHLLEPLGLEEDVAEEQQERAVDVRLEARDGVGDASSCST